LELPRQTQVPGTFSHSRIIERRKRRASRDAMRRGFFRDSAVITARLSQKWTDIVTPNQFSALETCTPVFVPWTPESVKKFQYNLIKTSREELCKWNLKEKGRKECVPSQCYWHRTMKEELEEAMSQPVIMSKKLWEEEGKTASSPELPNTGSQRQKRDPSSESLDHRPLKRGTSWDSERTNRPTSKQNNQSGQTHAEGQQKGILGLWTHPKWQAKVTEETISAINGLSDEDTVEALKELRRTKRFIWSVGKDQMLVPVHLQTLDDGHILWIIALLDSGCTGSCIDREFIRKNNIQTKKVPLPIPVYNADGSLNEGGPITEFIDVRMVIQYHTKWIQLVVSNLGKTELFIGHEWLKKHNLNIDWRMSMLTFNRCPKECDYITTLDDLEGDHDHEQVPNKLKIHLEKGERLFAFDINSYTLNRVVVDDGREQLGLNQKSPIFEERVLEHYHKYRDVFNKKDFDQLPERRIWDHVIKLTPDFKPIDCKIYPLPPKEQLALQELIEENLWTGRIRPSKSPNASPFFFWMKPDGSGLCPIQDYRKLNEFTVKNRYPLPLIGEIIDKLKGAKYFTKLDVRWGFNNVRIHEGDEWKAAFRTNLGLFEPTVDTSSDAVWSGNNHTNTNI
jgi:hypothetical protein